MEVGSELDGGSTGSAGSAVEVTDLATGTVRAGDVAVTLRAVWVEPGTDDTARAGRGAMAVGPIAAAGAAFGEMPDAAPDDCAEGEGRTAEMVMRAAALAGVETLAAAGDPVVSVEKDDAEAEDDAVDIAGVVGAIAAGVGGGTTAADGAMEKAAALGDGALAGALWIGATFAERVVAVCGVIAACGTVARGATEIAEMEARAGEGADATGAVGGVSAGLTETELSVDAAAV